PRKKRGLGGILLTVLIVSLSLYYVFITLFPAGGIRVAQIRSGSIGDIHKGEALIIRNEQVFSEEGVYSVEYIAEEGSVVYRQDPICKVYTSSYNQRDITNLAATREDIKTRQSELINEQKSIDQRLETLDVNVMNKAKEVRKIAQGAKGNLLNIEQDLAGEMKARKDYLRTAFSEDQRLTRLYNDENNYAQRINSFTRSRTATPQSSIVSFYTDGFENLSTNNMEEYSPSQVAQMIKGVKPEISGAERGKTPIYRLVEEEKWGVFFLIEKSNWTPAAGTVYQLKLEQFENIVVDAVIVSTSKAGDQLLLRMEVSAPVDQVLDMRTCKAELGENIGSLIVPKKSLYRQDDMIGVVVLVDGAKKTFVPVTVIKEEGNEAHIAPITVGLLYEGLTVLIH
ncbi:MAG: hypothetical protein GX786_10030, partial [Clostridiales bacterium]|nr:hypothetical protein [Clostridiales bacterium]